MQMLTLGVGNDFETPGLLVGLPLSRVNGEKIKHCLYFVDKGQAATQRQLTAMIVIVVIWLPHALPQQAVAWRFIPLRLRIFRVVSIR